MSDIIPTGVLYGNLAMGGGTTNYNDLDNKPSINNVTLQGNKTSSDLGLLEPGDIPVISVNGKTGAVVLDGTDIEYGNGTTINQKIDAVESEIPTVSYPVTSVNSKTGDVVLDGNDIAYGGGISVNQKINAVESEIPIVNYPVTSVNGETGSVVLDAADIEYSSGVSVKSKIDAVESEIPTSDTEIEHVAGISVNSIINTISQYTPVYGNTASGAIATFDTSLALPLQDCTIGINAVQESGTPTPSSPKLISGFTGANIHVADDETPHSIDNVTAISWQTEAGTVYGGSLDVYSNGIVKMIVEYACETYDNTNNWQEYANGNGYVVTPTGMASGSFYNDDKALINRFVKVNNNNSGLGARIGINNNRLYIVNVNNNITGVTDLTSWKNWLSSNSITLVYPLDTPVEYTLTSIPPIYSIVGTNNVFTDTNGNTSVVYACSLKDYIDSQ